MTHDFRYRFVRNRRFTWLCIALFVLVYVIVLGAR